ncbi:MULTISPECIES: CotH kinase family protein [Bacillaceae]|uniref:CotH kinase family protein n=1 Tax=Evansella alkalicola TaxID=745819 RepID=A0ABS6JVU5_9BACI|nr:MULTISPECIES: CotH kinase family protein [Bacillaceae]MBU9722705.1 CotH kinase family protein [Bacillus alkalicola]
MNKQQKITLLLLLPTLISMWFVTFYLVDSTPVSTEDLVESDTVDDTLSLDDEKDNFIVEFQDPTFEDALRKELNHIGDFTANQLQQIESLTLRAEKLVDISDIKHFTNLRSLDLRDNQIVNISSLASLPNLIDLNLRGNKIEDISALRNTTHIQELNLRENLIQDISALEGLESLRDLNLRYNLVSSIQPLGGLDNLTDRLYLNGNPIHDYTPLHSLHPHINETDFDIAPLFSQPGGFYQEEFHLELSTPNENATMYYTLDGSEPDPVFNPNSTYTYIDPILISDRSGDPNDLSMIRTAIDGPYTYWEPPTDVVFKGTVVKARVFNENGENTETVTNTYFIDEQEHNRYFLPVISISTNSDSFFGDATGLFVNENWENRGIEWEREANIEYFASDGTLGFSQPVGIRVHGGWSREAPLKSLRIYARSDYGTNLIFHDLFDNHNNLTHKRLILRNSGNDFHRTMFRDGLLQSLVSHMHFDTQSFQPSIVFINGEYWGIQNIRERYDDWYLANQYGVNQDNVTILENNAELDDGLHEGIEHYESMITFVQEHDLRNDDNYELLQTMMDIDNFIDYYVAQIYFANIDWPENNVRMWRYNTDTQPVSNEELSPEDGRWRWLLFDTDFGFGVQPGIGYSRGSDVDTNALERLIGEEWYQFLFTSLMENDHFKQSFISRFSDMLNTAFTPDRVVEELDRLYDIYKQEINEHIARWNIPETYDIWEKEVNIMRRFAQERPMYQWQHLQNFFRLGDRSKVTVEMDSTKGTVQINSIIIDDTTPGISNHEHWEGQYFKGVPVTITAIPEVGYEFVGWDSSINELNDTETVELELTEDLYISPIFEEIS